ncbi:DUF4179 domain-containing protein [Paenibacillus nuruki]|uniref:DUF4179 domain-containing protein n=1 Tax=Paenibacillus nuruki TaxID=1886670 RepID=UPI0028047C95|nr:DUF4179 domain-containing protein [Paenibacillus nuruki]CAJ1315699.1 hypothetical protein AASFL403_10785 [Paenibacillus nuruki]
MKNSNELQLHKQAQEIKEISKQVAEQHLEKSIMQGIERANRQKQQKSWQWKRPIWITTMVAILICTVGGIWISHAPISNTSVSLIRSGLPDYMNTLYRQNGLTKSLKSAVDHGLYQPINQKVESENYTLSIEGVVADSSRVMIFYTAKNRINDQGRAEIDSEEHPILMNQSQGMNVGNYFDNIILPDQDKLENKRSSHGLLIFDFASWSEVPDHITLSAKVHNGFYKNKEETLNIPFQIDTQKFEGLKKETIFNKSYTVQGYTFKLLKVSQTPLRTDTEFAWEPQSKGTLQGIYSNVFAYEPSGRIKSPFVINKYTTYKEGSATHFINYSESNYYASDQRLWVDIEKIKPALAKPISITINTEEKKIQATRDNKIEVSSVTQQDSHIKIALSYAVSDPDATYIFDMKSTFKDGLGKEYPLEGRMLYGNQEGQYELSFENKFLKQPLTFEILDYGGALLYMNTPIKEQIRK